ncbi:MAG: 16S rRNA (cytosine(967)-C(5))-methyltransferase RsmB [Clostridia bacterium]|nr:16S rRNA (cytosine(967)-C(5))-methyltransferase RsmB [Clostridia bacterium]
MAYRKNDPRRMALNILSRVLGPDENTNGSKSDGGYTNILLDSVISDSGISGPDRALLTRLVCGVTERKITLDYIIGKLSSRPVAKLDADVLNLLRLGIYQMRYMERIPAHAAINETVNLARPSGRGFVNAILRSYQRSGGIPLPDISTNAAYRFSVTYSVPEELCRRFIDIFGEKSAESVLSASNAVPPLTLRVNTLRTDRETLTAKLSSEGFACEPTPNSPYGIRVRGDGIPSAVLDGDAFVQDEASQLCTMALDPFPGCRMLDTCSCPGSKSFSSALLMKNEGKIISCDLHESKLPLITREAEKLGITVIETLCRDSSVPFVTDGQLFDRVLCDVPCSGFGVMAKKPEIRYRSLADAAELPSLQYSILEASCGAVAPGGVLVYSTCTLLPEENEMIADRFTAEHPDFIPVPLNLGNLTSIDGRITLLPDKNGTDGFFIAKFMRKKV